MTVVLGVTSFKYGLFISCFSTLRLRTSRLNGLDDCGNRVDGGRSGRGGSPPRSPRGGGAGSFGRGSGHTGQYSHDPHGGVDTISPGEGGLTPGSTFDASEVDRLAGLIARPNFSLFFKQPIPDQAF